MFNRVVAFFCVLFFSANVSAAITFISSVSDNGNDDKAALVVPTVAAGDVLLVQVAIRDRSGSDGVTAPSGWTQVGGQIADGSVLQSIYYRVATAGDTGVSYEWDFDQNGNRRYILGMSVFRGVDTANPIGSANSQIGMSGTGVTAPSVITTGANAMLVGLYVLEAGGQSFTPASGMLEAYDIEEHNNNNGITAMAAYAVQASAGATGDKVATASKSNDDAIGHLVALNEGATLPSVSTVGGSCGTDNLIVVQYASTVSDDALNVSNYTLTSGNITGITRQDGSTVVLATDGLVGGQAYTLSVQGNANTVSFDGLMGHYYDQRNSSGSKVGYPGGEFTGQQFLRLDNQVNFSWNTATPTVFPNVSGNDERFSIRWTGYISPATAGNYEFRLYSDDGARLSLDGTQIVNDWSLHSPRYSSVSASQALSVGQTYEVQMEHFEQTGQAFAQLEWRRDGGSWENIPTANLTTCAIPATPPLPPSVLEFRMDETSWNGTTGEVIDSSGNNNNATALNSLTTTNAGHLCRAGDFDGVDDYIESNDIYASLRGTSSMSFWIKTTQTGDDTGWRAPGIAGIEVAGGSDDIFWGWLDASGRIGLSVANDFTTKSTQQINDDAYHHIVLTRDAATGAYKIYIDGVLDKSGTLATGIIGNSFSSIGRIEDTGGTPEYFEGSLDELKIFDSVLSDTDVTTLFNETRICAPISSCAASFPDGLSSHDNGTINFGYQTKLSLSPDGILDASSVTRNGGALSVLTCDFVDCSASGGSVAKLSPGSFPIFSSGQSVNVGNLETKTLGVVGNTNIYDSVTVAGTLNVSPTFTSYYIKSMSLQYGGVLNLNAGDYWVDSLSISSSVTINVVGTGTARLFIKNTVSAGSATLINSPLPTMPGSPEKLLIYGYSNITLDSGTTTSAVVYAQGDIVLGSAAYLFGAATSSDINLNTDAQVSYDANAVSIIELGVLCTGVPSCSLGSFLITQPSYGLACPNARSPINIKAMCADGITVKSDYAGTIGLSSDQNTQSEFYLASSGGTDVSDVTLSGSESGEVNVYLFHKNENPDLKVTAEDAATVISTEALNGTDYRTSGFRVDRPAIFNFVCGSARSFTITAVGQDESGGGSCSTLTGFDGTKSLKAWADVNIDPSTLGVKNTGLPKRILLNGSAVAETKPSSSNMNVDFSAGVATVSVEYEDVGEVIDVNFEHDDPPHNGIAPTLVGSLGQFIVSPEKVIIEADSAASACASSLTTCTKFVRANEPFAMTSKALCIGTPELIAQSYRATVSLTSDLKEPSTGGTPAVPVVNQVAFDGAPSGGEEKISNQQIGEVGVFTITATPPPYFGVPVLAVESENIGRFYPASFDVSIVAADFNLSCNSSFTYMGQPFGYLTPPQVTIRALSYTNELTQNYEGGFWKLGANLDKGSSCTGVDSGFCYTDNVAGAALFSSPDAIQNYGSISNINGTITLTLHQLLSDEFNYQRPSSGAVVSPFDADVKLNIKLIDGDGVEGSGELANIGFSGDPDATPPGTPMNTNNNEYLKYGRWVLQNAFGPETNALKIPMSAEFYNGSNFVTNTADNCSTFDSVDMRIAPDLKNSGTTSASGSGAADTGLATLSDQIELSAPGDGKDGIAELCLDVESWLKFDWNGDGLDLSEACSTSATPTIGDNDNPMSTATFGRYRGHDRVIYWRELSN